MNHCKLYSISIKESRRFIWSFKEGDSLGIFRMGVKTADLKAHVLFCVRLLHLDYSIIPGSTEEMSRFTLDTMVLDKASTGLHLNAAIKETDE